MSDSYWKKDENYALECTAIVLNINLGHNKELMEKCRKLYEYSYLVAEIRKNQEKGLTIHAAIDEAVQTCIEQGILADFFAKAQGGGE